MTNDTEDKSVAAPTEYVAQLSTLPNELIDQIFGDLERPDLEAFLLNYCTRIKILPPSNKVAEDYAIQCVTYLTSLADWCNNLASLNINKPKHLEKETPPVLLLRKLTIALPQKEVNAELLAKQLGDLPEDSETESEKEWLETLEPELLDKVLNRKEYAFSKHFYYRPEVIENFLLSARGLQSLLVVGFRAPSWVGVPGPGLTAPWTKSHPKIALPPHIRRLTIKDITIRGRPEEPTSAWDWEIDQFGSDVLYNFESFGKMEKLRYVIANDEVEDCFRMFRLLHDFTGLRSLRIDNVPPCVEDRDPHLGQRRFMDRLRYKLPQSCHTLDIRPRTSFDPIGIWCREWPGMGSLRSIRTVRLPFRNVFEALMSTSSEHQLRFEVLVAPQELTDHHFTAGFTWLCPALKFLEELAYYFSTKVGERRSLVFIQGISSGDGPDPMWSPSPSPHQQWEVNAKRSIERLPKWTSYLDEFVFQQAGRLFPDAEEFFEFIHLHHPARGHLGVQCRGKNRGQAHLEVLYDSDDSGESFGLLSDAEDEDDDGDADDGLYGSAGEDSN